ncbi:unnamed protein product [Cyclocybe aegerita]|uniref:Ubiquitin-like domain-containing protein n=1 Tax=Cyclocybe aegerita TaxID=1973307 RepID=A0A8S0VZG1_CYCAE|nr:unnamed protein product [Cyclocybe aegerita]
MGAQPSIIIDTIPDNLDGKDARGSIFLFIYEGRRKLTCCPSSHAAAVTAVWDLFPEISYNQSVSFHTDELPICGGEMTEVSPASWDKVTALVDKLTVRVESQENGERVELIVKSMTGRQMLLKVPSSMTVRSLKQRIGDYCGVPSGCEEGGDGQGQLRLIFSGRDLDGFLSYSLKECGIKNLSVIHMMQILRGAKPVIYLFAPDLLEATVRLSLSPQWGLSAIYPVVPITQGTTESLEKVIWSVRVNPGGTLMEHITGLEVAYLFWEATTNHIPPASPTHGTQLHESFDPSHPILNAENSVVIPVTNITPYLDKELQELGLHTEARMSFISFWLPAMLKHKYIALRFLPQDAYERAAPLAVTPRPDVITRVYMVFQGVGDEDLASWDAARKRGTKEQGIWKYIVGVDKSRIEDKGLFRVLEWGGMEIPLLNCRQEA